MKLLIIDDSEFMRQQLKTRLEAGDYEVAEAESAEDVYKLLENDSFDLVTLDIEMPDVNGFEVCSAIRNGTPTEKVQDIPIICVTSKDEYADRMKGFESGGTDFITKQDARHHLLSVVNGILRPEKKYHGITALVVDDGRVVRRIVSSPLAQLGVESAEAESGEEALEILKTDAQQFDLIILDQILPGLSGVEVCDKIRKEIGLREIPVIFLTGRTQSQDILSMFQSGGTDYVSKPFLKEEFLGPH